MQCVLRNDVLKKIFPTSVQFTYEDYYKNTPDIIYELKIFQVQGIFTLNQENDTINTCNEQ